MELHFSAISKRLSAHEAESFLLKADSEWLQAF
jgi:hypothetical protein